ncbi:AsmA-like C-terminal region-containing protein [Winogradskyella litorisediminis]|uniref:AsmA-like C-terminal region-containing protein n=1 Tax=Winogradskyella litorisediminis TaxID=1156618 RepID=A0ABW3N6X1_9FLAO
MKKIFKILGILVAIFLVILISVPFFLESKIDAIVQNYADENLNAKLSFDDVNLSLISSFPQAKVSVKGLKIETLAPFEDETLALAKNISFEMPLAELFNDANEPLTVNEIIADELLLTLKTNASGNVNYDIVKPSEVTEGNSEANAFSFDIEHYEINKGALTYIDEGTNTNVYVTEINHTGNGIFSGGTSELDTESEANITLSIDNIEYLSNNSIKLDALIDLDLEQSKYTFKENKGFINQLPIEFQGYIQQVEKGQNIDLTFKNPESSFKSFLAIIPKTYAKNIENVNTTGDFTLNGKIKGLVSDETIPTLDFKINSNNASFKYPDLPKKVDNIIIDASVINTTGNLDDTYIDINTLNFKIDQDVFRSEAHIKNLTKNIYVDANLDGVLNLANLTKAYPVELENELSGILKGKLNTAFDMNAIETNAYQRIKNTGNVSIENFIFSSEDIVNPLQINIANLSFNPGTVTLQKFDALTGESDISATGTINNLLGFLLSDKKLTGNFNVFSNKFKVADFMVEDEAAASTSNKTTSKGTSLKIPEFLDATITAKANTVVYDNLNLKNVTGKLLIRNQIANLADMTTDVFNGKLGLSGNISTAEDKPKFDMVLAINQFDIAQSFEELEMLKAIAPIAKVLQGKLTSSITLNGLLDESFSPDLSTIAGNALAELATINISESQSKILQGLDSKLDFIDFSKLDLKDLKTRLSFNNGQVDVKPFTINYKDIPIEISGSHSFSNTVNYNLTLQVPAKYLGSDVNRLIGKINDTEVNKISIPVTANVTGTFASPNVSTDLTSGVKNLTAQLVEIQKQKLIDKGTDKVSGLLDNILGGKDKTPTIDSTKVDSTKTNPKNNVKEGVKNILGGILKNRKKDKDSTKN